MNKQSTLLPLFLLALCLCAGTAGPARAQSVSVGADVMSRYVWRGTDFGNAISIQPTLEISTGSFTIGSWGAYSIAETGTNEHDLYASVAFGPVSVGVTDYYFPDSGSPDFFNFDGGGSGSHWIEPFVSVSGPETFPVSLMAGMFVHNDPDNSVYIQADYPFRIDGVSLNVTAAVVPMKSAFYLTDGFSFVNVGLSATKAVPITDAFSLPVSVSYILNPNTERTFLVFGVSF